MPKQRSRRISLTSSITARPCGGGNKKQGLVPRSTGKNVYTLWRGGSTPEQRAKESCSNRIGGVGRGMSQTKAPADGARRCVKFPFVTAGKNMESGGAPSKITSMALKKKK